MSRVIFLITAVQSPTDGTVPLWTTTPSFFLGQRGGDIVRKHVCILYIVFNINIKRLDNDRIYRARLSPLIFIADFEGGELLKFFLW